MALPLLNPLKPNQNFPDIKTALTEPNGLLAIGGCLSSQRIINAYRLGIFPWYSFDEPILWWSPDPRLILFPKKIKISRSLKKTMCRVDFSITYNQAFTQVVQFCAASRSSSVETWITPEIRSSYTKLHQQGMAHSFEVWSKHKLVGGLYGVAIGKVFFGESMFYKKTDASKIAFCKLVSQLTTWGYKLIDCQVSTKHLISFGAEEIERKYFLSLLNLYCPLQPSVRAWK